MNIFGIIGAAAWLAAAPWPDPPGTTCTSRYDSLLNRWETQCADGTYAVSTWDSLLQRWTTTITRPASPPPKKEPTR